MTAEGKVVSIIERSTGDGVVTVIEVVITKTGYDRIEVNQKVEISIPCEY